MLPAIWCLSSVNFENFLCNFHGLRLGRPDPPALLEDRCDICLFPSSGFLQILQPFKGERGLATMLAGFWMYSIQFHWLVSIQFTWVVSSSIFLYCRWHFHPWTMLLLTGTWEAWGQTLTLAMKRQQNHWLSQPCLCHYIPTFSFIFLLLLVYLWKPSCCLSCPSPVLTSAVFQ